MSFVVASFRKDISRWRQDWLSILIWLAIPFLMGGLITAMVDRGDDGGPLGTLLIADDDDTLLSGLIAGAFAQEQLGEMFAVQNVSIEAGLELVEAGEASGFLIIPEGFQEAFLNDTPVTLTLKTNPSQTILPGIIQDVTEIILDLGFYAQAMFGPEIAQIQNADTLDQPADLFTAEIAVQIQHKMEKLGPKLSPPLLDVEIVEPPPAEPRPDFALMFLPGIVMMALLFSAQGLSSDYWKERQTGTLRRLASTPGLLGRFVLGKALAAAVVISFLGGTTLVFGFLYHDVSWSKLPSSMAWIVVGGVGFFAWFAALQMSFSNQKGASLISMILLLSSSPLTGQNAQRESQEITEILIAAMAYIKTDLPDGPIGLDPTEATLLTSDEEGNVTRHGGDTESLRDSGISRAVATNAGVRIARRQNSMVMS
ncbi:MAG: ABC transporter permease [Proteobacteria bacterium]|nr:ABC transporter permease [Pseudomonadota bacterium]